MKTLFDVLSPLSPCDEPGGWLNQFGTDELRECWEETWRSDWLLWLLRKVGAPDAKMRLVAVLCAAEVAYLMDDERSLYALDVAHACAIGEADGAELGDARAAARAAALDVSRVAALDVSRVAARDVAWDATRSAEWDAASDTLSSAAWAAALDVSRVAALGATSDESWGAVRTRQSDIIREVFTFDEVEPLLKARLS
ncbi:MAG: hypothetical protein ACPG6R_10895 [Aequoribacter sp.]|uniref:hypothetical protein n=1 Tax=Aequoribacter sp. TaxID=2847771 RepID=UPI003C648519